MNPLTSPAEIRRLLERGGFRFSKALGQNFLIDGTVPERIAESVRADRDCAVLEVGPGIGCLTAELAERAGKVLSVELDRRLEPILKETLSGRDNTEILFADVMRLDLSALAEEKLNLPTKLVCANLPYNITSPVLTAMAEAGCFERICVMIQKEVAERICAAPGTKSYGSFGLFLQWSYEPELLFTVPPHCFMPQPKVTSAVLRLTRRQSPPAEVLDEELMFRLIRAAFNQRRKTLANALSHGFRYEDRTLTREEVTAALRALGLPETIRGEALSLEQFAALSRELAAS